MDQLCKAKKTTMMLAVYSIEGTAQECLYYLTRNMSDPEWHIQWIECGDTENSWKPPVIIRNKAALEALLHAPIKERIDDEHDRAEFQWFYMQDRTVPPPYRFNAYGPCPNRRFMCDNYIYREKMIEYGDDIDLDDGLDKIARTKNVRKKMINFVMKAAESLIATA